MQEDDELFLLEDEYALRGGSPPGVAGTSAEYLGSAGSVTSPISTGSALPGGGTPDWWRYDSMFTDETVDELLEAKCRTMASSGNHSATTGERLTMDRRKAVDVYRNEINKASISSDAEASIIVHEDICNKSIRSSDSSSSTTTCTTTKFSTGERCSEAAAAATVRGDCSNSSGAVAAPAGSVAGAVVKMSVDQQQQQQQRLKPSSYGCSSSNSSSSNSSSNSNNGSGGIRARGSCGIITEEELEDEVEIEEEKKARMQALHPLNSDATTTQHLPELMHWTNETCVNNGLFADDVLSDQLWISAPINGTHLTQDQHHHQPHFTEPPGVACGGVMGAYGTTIDHYVEPKISPISLHDEIEQLSATWDCDAASNHLASAPPFAALHYTSITADDPMLCAASSPVPITESVSLNMLRWLEEDISSSFDNQQPQQPQQPPNPESDHGPGLALGVVAAAPAQTPSPPPFKDNGEERSQPVGHVSVFGQSLDLIQNLLSLAPDSHPSESTNQSQRDHNYFTIKRSHADLAGHSELPRKRLRQNTDKEEPENEKHQEETSKKECKEAIRKPSDTKRAKQDSSAAKMYTATNATTSTISVASTTVAATTTMSTRLNTTTSATTDLAIPSAPHYTTRPPAGKDKKRPAAMALRLDVSAQPLRSNGGSNLNHPHNPVSALTVDTPDLTNDILDLEDEKFDLLSFIDATPAEENTLELKNIDSRRDSDGLTSILPSVAKKEEDDKKTVSTVEDECISLTPSLSLPLYHLLTIDTLNQLTEATGGLPSPSGRYQVDQDLVRAGSGSSASSVYGGDSSSDVSFSSSKPPKRRGRPPKTPGGTLRDRSAYQHLSEADWRYREQRDKNNEASRKSRINRKDRELKLEAEADELSDKHRKLSFDEKRLQRECQKWRKAVMKLALL
ncbi:uncharacterized protein LOC118465235 [Anopheles albimanus]|uniref:uncharacterized protein LOC118465235 n=1 Tax=Anopheles albimanus TaxID=7167 RepID=UPI0016419C35|nr:uncharacterized protein LOC118465235 [Anopheles albimanus]